jgi:hypothetical protein
MLAGVRLTLEVKMTGRKCVLLCCVVAVLMIAAASFAEGSGMEGVEEAVKVAESWLALIDRGEYGKSWDQSADLFRAALTREKWAQALEGSRRPLGELVSRKVKSKQYETSLPGAPDGEYVVVQFSTSFTKKKSGIETVTPMKDPDGVWRVSGYYIK